MEFDNIFENKNKYHGKYRKQRYHDDYKYSQESHHSSHGHDHLKWLRILEIIRNNKKLKLLVIVGGIIVLAIIIILIFLLFPLIIKLFNYISQYGLQGIVDGIAGFLSKIWTGTGK